MEIDFNWLTKCKENIDNSGLSQVKAHSGTDGHKVKVEVISGTTSQRGIVTSNDNNIPLGSNKNIVVNRRSSHLCRDIASLRLCSVQSFICLIQRSLNLTNRERWKLNMLYSSELLHLWRNRWLETLNCNHLSLSYDKTSTCQLKKQHNGYVQFWSNKEKQIVHRLLYQYNM